MTNPFATFDPPLAGPPVLEPTDVSYVLEDTEVGRLLLAVRDDGAVVTCAYAPDTASEDRWLTRLATGVSPRVLRHAGADGCRRGARSPPTSRARPGRSTCGADLALASPFQREVLTGLAARVGLRRAHDVRRAGRGRRAPGGGAGRRHRARARTRCASCCPATGCCPRPAGSAGTPAGRPPRSTCWRSRRRTRPEPPGCPARSGRSGPWSDGRRVQVGSSRSDTAPRKSGTSSPRGSRRGGGNRRGVGLAGAGDRDRHVHRVDVERGRLGHAPRLHDRRAGAHHQQLHPGLRGAPGGAQRGLRGPVPGGGGEPASRRLARGPHRLRAVRTARPRRTAAARRSGSRSSARRRWGPRTGTSSPRTAARRGAGCCALPWRRVCTCASARATSRR